MALLARRRGPAPARRPRRRPRLPVRDVVPGRRAALVRLLRPARPQGAASTVEVRCPPDWTVVGNGPAQPARARPLAAGARPARWRTYFVTLVAGPYHSVRDEHDGIPLGLHARRSLAEHLRARGRRAVRAHQALPRPLHAAVRRALPVRRVPPGLRARLQRRRDGEPGLRDAARQYVFRSAATDAERCDRAVDHRARDGAHVVRRPGHHALVGRPVAQRVVRRVPRPPGRPAEHRPGLASSASAARPGATAPTGGRRRTRWRATARPTPRPRWPTSTASPTPRAPRCCGSWPPTSATRCSSPGCAATSHRHAVRQRRVRRPDRGLDRGRRPRARRLDRSLAAHDRASTSCGSTAPTSSAPAPAARRGRTRSRWPRSPPTARETGRARVDPRRRPHPARPARSPGWCVPDAADETWAKIALPTRPGAAWSTRWRGSPTPRTRVVLWNALRLAVADAELDPALAVDVVLRALPAEADDVLAAVGGWAVGTLLAVVPPATPRGSRRRSGSRRRCSHVVDRARRSGSGRQLAAARVAVVGAGRRRPAAATGSTATGLPAGLVAGRRAALGGAAPALARSARPRPTRSQPSWPRDHSSQGAVHAAGCLAARPDAAAKAEAWQTLTVDAGPVQLRAVRDRGRVLAGRPGRADRALRAALLRRDRRHRRAALGRGRRPAPRCWPTPRPRSTPTPSRAPSGCSPTRRCRPASGARSSTPATTCAARWPFAPASPRCRPRRVSGDGAGGQAGTASRAAAKARTQASTSSLGVRGRQLDADAGLALRHHGVAERDHVDAVLEHRVGDPGRRARRRRTSPGRSGARRAAGRSRPRSSAARNSSALRLQRSRARRRRRSPGPARRASRPPPTGRAALENR